MKIVLIRYENNDSQTTITELGDLKDPDGNALDLPLDDPDNNLVFDPRPIEIDRQGCIFTIQIQDSSHLIVTRTDENEGWGRYDNSRFRTYRHNIRRRHDNFRSRINQHSHNIRFRMYDRTKEDIPSFYSSVPYDYWGLKYERAPHDTVVAKVRRTATTIQRAAFCGYIKMTMCDMSDAPVDEIKDSAFYECTSLRTILFSRVLKKIRWNAFAKCQAIILVIPSTVTDIESWAFFGCKKLRILKLPDAIELDNIHNDIIYKCDTLLAKVPPNQTPKQWLKDRYNPYPLHKICYNAHITVEDIQQCIHEHPHAAYLTDEFDMTALHMISIMACTSNIQTGRNHQYRHQDITTSVEFSYITTCFDANMSAALSPDDRGMTPLDYLLEYSQLNAHTSLVASLCMHWNASVGASSTSCHHDSLKKQRCH